LASERCGAPCVNQERKVLASGNHLLTLSREVSTPHAHIEVALPVDHCSGEAIRERAHHELIDDHAPGTSISLEATVERSHQ
jgi:hypothetical protein